MRHCTHWDRSLHQLEVCCRPVSRTYIGAGLERHTKAICQSRDGTASEPRFCCLQLQASRRAHLTARHTRAPTAARPAKALRGCALQENSLQAAAALGVLHGTLAAAAPLMTVRWVDCRKMVAMSRR